MDKVIGEDILNVIFKYDSSGEIITWILLDTCITINSMIRF